jgi:hypothetical protein
MMEIGRDALQADGRGPMVWLARRVYFPPSANQKLSGR